MKGILEFSLPEEQEEFDVANNAWKFKSVITGLDNKLRSILKHEQDSHTPDEHKCYQKIRDLLHELVKDNDVNLY